MSCHANVISPRRRNEQDVVGMGLIKIISYLKLAFASERKLKVITFLVGYFVKQDLLRTIFWGA